MFENVMGWHLQLVLPMDGTFSDGDRDNGGGVTG